MQRRGADGGTPSEPASTGASVLCGGERVPIVAGELTIGRAEDSGLAIAHERVSRRHARIYAEADDWWIADLGSRHGTLLNGGRLGGEARRLASGDAIAVGDRELRFLGGETTRIASREVPITETQTVRFDGERLRIGRDARNDVVLADPNVSRFHAEVHAAGDGRLEVRDLGSSNGTRLDGELIGRATVAPGSSLGIGCCRLVFDGTGFLARDERGSMRLDADRVSVHAGEKTILHEASASLGPGELVAIIGESGAGKSTLLKLLAGVTRPDSGRVAINGEPIAARLTDVGYVPQDEIVHALLSVREGLGYAARLRLPSDASDRELDEAVERALGELALGEHAETMIGALSGGQRKRTGVASEILGRPGLLFLDEPTTGMDPGLESRMMALFRTLADRERGVALVTHATKNLALCDRVVVLARGGHLVFDGPPAAALAFFEVDDYDGIYTALDERPVETWSERAEPSAGGPEPAAQPPRDAGRPPPRGLARQTAVLTGRALKLLLRDRRNLALLVGQAPLLAIAGIALFRSGIMDRSGGDPAQAIQMLFLALITVIWLGSIDAARELVKERAVFEREAAIGVRLSSYLLSKLIVLFGLITVQTALYGGLLFAFRPLDEPAGTWGAVFALLLVTGFAAVAMGLLISAVVSTEAQAMSVIPLAVIPQLLFAGTIVPLARMPEPAHSISYAIFSQWSLAGVGDAVDMNSRIAADPAFSQASPYGERFFDLALPSALAIEAGFALLFLAGVVALLRRRVRG